MYTEIKEMVNFLAIYAYHRMAKRQICLCMESYANHLVTLFHDNWRTNDPFHAENQRTVAIKASDSLDIILHMVAVNLRINSDEFYDCFPMNFYIYCNPGEVSCHIAGYSSLINIWRGDVNEDRYYDPAPIGVAKYYDGNLNNFQNIVLRSVSSTQESYVHLFGHMGPEQCVPLCLADAAVLPAYDLFASGFVDIFRIPSTLFRWNSANTEYFTTRTFAAIRFGKRRAAHNYENIYQIQYNVAYLSDDENIMDEVIAEQVPDNFPDNYQSDSEKEHNFSNPSSMTYGKANHFDPASGTVNSSPSMFLNPSRSLTTSSDQFVADVSSVPTIDSANQFFLRQNISFLGYHYDILKPVPPSDNDNSIGLHVVNYYVPDSPFFATAHNNLNLMQPQEDTSPRKMLPPHVVAIMDSSATCIIITSFEVTDTAVTSSAVAIDTARDTATMDRIPNKIWKKIALEKIKSEIVRQNWK